MCVAPNASRSFCAVARESERDTARVNAKITQQHPCLRWTPPVYRIVADAWPQVQVSTARCTHPQSVLCFLDSSAVRGVHLCHFSWHFFGELRSLSAWWPGHPRRGPALTALQPRRVHGWGVPADVATAAANGHLLTDGIVLPAPYKNSPAITPSYTATLDQHTTTKCDLASSCFTFLQPAVFIPCILHRSV
jgi:hypothetical protein